MPISLSRIACTWLGRTPEVRRTLTSTESGSLSGMTTAASTTLLGIMIWSAPRVSVVYSRPSELTMPSTWPPTAPACSRIRSPTRNGRALSSTMPAIALPSVCWAARPKMTAVKPPPTASVCSLAPATLSATSTVITIVSSRIRKPTVPAVAGSIRRRNVGPAKRLASRASAQPIATSASATPICRGVCNWLAVCLPRIPLRWS